MENFNVLNRVITIEDWQGNGKITFEIDDKGNIIRFENCSVADIEDDYMFDSGKELIRIQADDDWNEM